MLIDNLVRLGRLLTKGNMPPEVILKEVTDIDDSKSGRFYNHVIVVELEKTASNGWKIAKLPNQVWGSYEDVGKRKKKTQFTHDVERALAAPIIIPGTGDKTKPQGRYQVPAYIVYNSSLKKFIKELSLKKFIEKLSGCFWAYYFLFHLSLKKFIEKPDEIQNFLDGRIQKTIDFNIPKEQLSEIANCIYEGVQELELTDKTFALILVANIQKYSPYEYSDKIPDNSFAYVGPSQLHPGKQIIANLQKMLDRLWKAKMGEGEECGLMEGSCSLCSKEGTIVSIYSKAWTWFTLTWKAPLPMELEEKNLVEGVGLCSECYGALDYGARIFSRFAKPLYFPINKQLFTPVSNYPIRDKKQKLDRIYGCALVLPLLDSVMKQGDVQDSYCRGIRGMLAADENSDKGKLALHIQQVTGFEIRLPEEISSDQYRMTLVYFRYGVNQADPHIEAIIEDVIPSTVEKLTRICQNLRHDVTECAKRLFPQISEKHEAFLKGQLTSVPYLLTKAYGSAYLWQTLENILRGTLPSRAMFVRNVGHRMDELSRRFPKVRQKMKEEVLFFIVFGQFLHQIRIGKEVDKVKDWKALLDMVHSEPIEQLEVGTPGELGFLCGCITRQFASQYYAVTKSRGGGKNFLKHRVMTFGSSLTPETVWKRALSKMQEYAIKMNMGLKQDLRQRIGVALMEYQRLEESVKREKDEFMASFWAGYFLGNVKDNEQEG